MHLCRICFSGAMQDAPQVYSGSELQQRVMQQTGVHVALVDAEDQRASQCPAGQTILRVAGGRDQVGKTKFRQVRFEPGS